MKKNWKIMTLILGCSTIGIAAAIPCALYKSNTTINVTNDALATTVNNFSTNNISVKRIKTAYAWKKYDANYAHHEMFDTYKLTYLNTTFDVDFNSTKYQNNWNVTEYDLGNDGNQLYKKYYLKQNQEADNNSRAILMQFEVEAKVPANSIVSFDSNLSIAGNLHINGHFSDDGYASVEAEMSDFSDSQELNITPGNNWNKETFNDDQFKDIRDYAKDNVITHGNKNILITYNSGWSGMNAKFNWSKNEKITFENSSSEDKIIKKYFNAYLLTSAWNGGGGDHHVESTDLFVKFTNPTIKHC